MPQRDNPTPTAGPSPALLTAAIVVMVLIWGSTWSVIRIGLEGLPPFGAVSLRFAIAGILLLLLARARAVRMAWTRGTVGLLVINALFTFTLAYGAVYVAELWIPSGLAALLFAVFPIIVASLAHFLLDGERLRPRSAVGVVLGFAGVAVIFSQDLDALTGERGVLGGALVLLAAFSSATGEVTVKRWGGSIHPLLLTGLPMLLTAAITGVVSLLLERQADWLWTVRTTSSLLYLAVAGSAVSFTLYFWALKHVAASRLALIAYAIPVVAVCIGVFGLDEPMTGPILVGGGLVAIGVALATRSKAGDRGSP